MAAETDYRSEDPVFTCEHYLVSANRSYAELREAHIRDHQRLFRRLQLELADQSSHSKLFRLPTDERFRDELISTLERLPEQKIGKYGHLQEWLADYEENEPGHRHISHLFALFLGHQITIEDTPKLAHAAGLSLEGRVCGRGATWPAARFWHATCWARLGEGDRAYATLQEFIQFTP